MTAVLGEVWGLPFLSVDGRLMFFVSKGACTGFEVEGSVCCIVDLSILIGRCVCVSI